MFQGIGLTFGPRNFRSRERIVMHGTKVQTNVYMGAKDS